MRSELGLIGTGTCLLLLIRSSLLMTMQTANLRTTFGLALQNMNATVFDVDGLGELAQQGEL